MLASCFCLGGCMNRCIIIAPLYNGEEREWLTPVDGDFVICADAGFRAAQRYGIHPDLTIGDFDSLNQLPDTDCYIRLPVHKDDTDMVACISEGRERGYRNFILAGSIGGRFDHTYACLQCVADCAARGESAWLCDAQNRVTVLMPGEYKIPRVEGRKLSIFAYTPSVTGIHLQGTFWTLRGAELTATYPLGCSNEFVADEALLAFESGMLVLCLSKD